MGFILLGILNAQAAGAGAPIVPAVAGYVAGGFRIPDTLRTDTVDKFAFPSDSRTTLGTGLSVAKRLVAGFSNPSVAGYVAGGDTLVGGSSQAVSTVEKFAFPSDSRTILETGLSVARDFMGGFFNIEVAGYAAGGRTLTSTVDKFAFPSDSRTTLATGLSASRQGLTGFSNPNVAGYASGGFEAANVSTVDKFEFPTDSRTTLATGLSAARQQSSGFLNQSVAGYVAGGLEAAAVSTVDKFAFPSDSRTTLATGLSVAVSDVPSGFSSSLVAGYSAGGRIGTGDSTDTVDKFAFPSDSRTTLGTGLSVAKHLSAGFQNA